MEIAEQNPMVEDVINLYNASMEVSHENPIEATEQTEPSATTDPPPPCLPVNKFLVSGTPILLSFPFSIILLLFTTDLLFPSLCLCFFYSSGGLLKALEHGSARGRPESCRTVCSTFPRSMPYSVSFDNGIVCAFCRMLEKRSMSYVDGLVLIPADDSFLVDNVQRICVCDTGIIFSC